MIRIMPEHCEYKIGVAPVSQPAPRDSPYALLARIVHEGRLYLGPHCVVNSPGECPSYIVGAGGGERKKKAAWGTDQWDPLDTQLVSRRGGAG